MNSLVFHGESRKGKFESEDTTLGEGGVQRNVFDEEGAALKGVEEILEGGLELIKKLNIAPLKAF